MRDYLPVNCRQVTAKALKATGVHESKSNRSARNAVSGASVAYPPARIQLRLRVLYTMSSEQRQDLAPVRVFLVPSEVPWSTCSSSLTLDFVDLREFLHASQMYEHGSLRHS